MSKMTFGPNTFVNVGMRPPGIGKFEGKDFYSNNLEFKQASGLFPNNGVIDADAAAWSAAVTANGGTVNAVTLRAVTWFCEQAKAAGYWNKLLRVNLFAGDQLAAALVPLKVGGGGALEVGNNLVAGDYSLSRGITGDKVNQKYIDTGFVPRTQLANQNDVHLGVFNVASVRVNDSVQIGCFSDAVTDFFDLASPYSDGLIYADIAAASLIGFNPLPGTAGAVGVKSFIGFVVACRAVANECRVYQQGTLLGIDHVDSSANLLPLNSMRVLATGDGLGPAQFSGDTIGGYTVGNNLTADEAYALSLHMQYFQATLGRS